MEEKLSKSNRTGSGCRAVREAGAEIGKRKRQLSENEAAYTLQFFKAMRVQV